MSKNQTNSGHDSAPAGDSLPAKGEEERFMEQAPQLPQLRETAGTELLTPANRGELAATAGNSTEEDDRWNKTKPLPGVDVATADRDDPLVWFATHIGRPDKDDLNEMIRWSNRTMVEESIIEYEARWISKCIPILDRLDSILSHNVQNIALIKRTFLLVIAADYMHKPRYQVFQNPNAGSRSTFDKWLKRPELRSIFDDMTDVMQTEIVEHELSEIRKSVRTTRIAASRAAEVRASLLEHPNPWVALQSARDIMQSADRQTAAKGTENVNINATLSEKQVEQLLARASNELAGWDTRYVTGHTAVDNDDSPIIIVGSESKHDIPSDDEELFE